MLNQEQIVNDKDTKKLAEVNNRLPDFHICNRMESNGICMTKKEGRLPAPKTLGKADVHWPDIIINGHFNFMDFTITAWK